MLQPPVLDLCRKLEAAAVYVESNGTHLLNSAYGNPRSEAMSVTALACLPMDEASGTGGTGINNGVAGNLTYSGTHTQVADSPAADPGWNDPITKCTLLSNGAHLKSSVTYNDVTVDGKGAGIGFWYKHPAGANNTAHTAMDFACVGAIGGAGDAAFLRMTVTFASDSGCRKPIATVSNGTKTFTLQPNDNQRPWEAYGHDNEWHHIMVTWNSNTAYLYLDGLRADTQFQFGFSVDSTAGAVISVGADFAGNNGTGQNAAIQYCYPTVHRMIPSREDVAKLVASFTRPLDIVIDGTITTGTLDTPEVGTVCRCDHGHTQVMQINQNGGTTDRNFRVSNWKNLEHALIEALSLSQNLFLMHQLKYNTTVASPASNQGDTKVFDLEGVGNDSWPICGGTYSPSAQSNQKDGFYFQRKNRGWELSTTYKEVGSGNAVLLRTYSNTTIYPAQEEQEYESVLLQHEVLSAPSSSRLRIRQGATGVYQESSPILLRSSVQLESEAHGGTAMRPAGADAGRYSTMAYFRNNVTAEQYQKLRRLSLGQAQLRARPGMRAANRHMTQNAPNRVQGFIQ